MLQQKERKNNIEITNTVPYYKVENNLVEIFPTTDSACLSQDFEDCHLIKKSQNYLKKKKQDF